MDLLKTTKYHKIHSLYKRGERGRMLFGEFSRPEFAYLQDAEWIGTEKVDGTNVRVIFLREETGYRVIFGGRTERADLPGPLREWLDAHFTPTLAEALFPDLRGVAVLYGEGFGNRIQKEGWKYKSDGVGFVLFDVRVGAWWLGLADVADVARKAGVPAATVLTRGSLAECVQAVQDGLRSELAETDREAEGVVARPAVELFDRAGERVLTKIKIVDFRSAAR